MKDLILQYKPFLLFLGKFLLSYLVLTVIYQAYLGRFDAQESEVDFFTTAVATQTAGVLSLVDHQSYTMPNFTEPCVKLIYHGKYISRIVEGCNALSIMILFVAFIVAFTGKFKHMVFFILSGCVLIHILNVARIALLCIAMYFYPQYNTLFHDLIFPLLIYGFVFLLWVIWVNKYSHYATEIKRK